MADGRNSTAVTIQASSYTTLGPWFAYVDITPVYGLNYYWGYGYRRYDRARHDEYRRWDDRDDDRYHQRVRSDRYDRGRAR